MNLTELASFSDKVISAFIQDWQRTPYCWLQEIDIQSELAHRFHESLPEARRCIRAIHDHEPGKPNWFRRVTCEPYVKLPVKSWMHPDIVIWSDQESGSSKSISSGAYPIDLICEIKYSFDTIVSGAGEDLKRLQTSLESDSQPKLAIQLLFIQKPVVSGDTVRKTPFADGRLIVYQIQLLSDWGANAA